jgi:hypothetical protein
MRKNSDFTPTTNLRNIVSDFLMAVAGIEGREAVSLLLSPDKRVLRSSVSRLYRAAVSRLRSKSSRAQGIDACGLASYACDEELAPRGVASVRSKPKHAFVPIRVKSTAVIKRSSGAN